VLRGICEPEREREREREDNRRLDNLLKEELNNIHFQCDIISMIKLRWMG
jgi:hypothetical protein